MLASIPASMVNQKPTDLGIPIRFNLSSSRLSHVELNSRAALCRQLAKHEPANQAIWMAEAENWLRLSKEKLQGEVEAKSVPARPVSARQAPAP